MRRRLISVALMVSCLLLVHGCGGDDGGGAPSSVTGVDISPDEANVEIGHTRDLTVQVSGGDSKTLDWYVNGVPDGNSTWGTISQNSPVTYTGPDSLPSPSTVVVKAISREDKTRMDSCTIHLGFTKIFVDAGNGDDVTGTGCVNIPVKSITRGLELVEKGMTVLAQPGLYDQANGEVFRITVPESVSVVGMDWETCIMRGHLAYEQTVLMDGKNPVFRKFTLEQGEPADTAWNHAIYVQATDGLMDSIRVHERANYSIVRLPGTANMTVQNCHFVIDDGQRLERGFEIITANTGTVVRDCVLQGFNTGLWITGEQDVMIEGCRITTTGVAVGLVYTSSSNPEPDLGGGPRGCAGGNIFTDYTDCGFRNPTPRTIYAMYNTWDNSPPQPGVDYCNDGDGNVVVD